MSQKVELLPYNPLFTEWFEQESQKLKKALGASCIAIHHIGSTAVPGLYAKPKLDMLMVVSDTNNIITLLEKDGYAYKGEINIPFHFYFTKKTCIPKVNLHVYQEGHPEIDLNLTFRDYLRAHPEMRDAYGNLKLSLANSSSSYEKRNSIFNEYSLGKDTFISDVLNLAGFKRLYVHHSAHHKEWEAARTFRQKYFFDKVPIADPYTWTFSHKDHGHFVLYQGALIVGYAHIQLWPNHRAALRIIVVGEEIRKQGFGSYFLDFIEKWLAHKAYSILQTQASPEAYAFYKKHSYTEMPFNDPDGYEGDPQDIDMGKLLILDSLYPRSTLNY